MEDLIPIFALLTVFGSLTAIILGPTYFKARERRETQETIRRALDKGQPLPPEVIEAMTKDVAKNLPSRTRDIRRGVIWIAVGAGIAAFSVVSEIGDGDRWAREVDSGLLGIACIPFIIGLAFVVLSFFNKNKD